VTDDQEVLMPDGGLQSEVDVRDFARGTDFLSASGGGSPAEPIRLLLDDLDRGVELRWSELAEIPDDALVASAFFSGSVAPDSYGTDSVEREHGVERRVERPLVQAVEELERQLARPIDALISVEIGGTNTTSITDAAANLGKTLLDGDYAGRAIPEAQCITPSMFGESIVPLAGVDFYGDISIVKQAANTTMAERLGKFIAMAAFGHVGCAAIPLSGAVVKRIAIAGTLSEALAIGQAIRTAREAGDDPVQAVTDTLPGARILTRGSVAKRTWENRDGYMWGEHEIEGNTAYAGRLRLWFKNENHLSWLNDEPYVCSPDIIEVVDDTTGEPRVNTDIAVGDQVAVVAVPRRAQFDSAEGIDALGPRHWGFDLDFQPLESFAQ
jgi:DUF917 family protein